MPEQVPAAKNSIMSNPELQKYISELAEDVKLDIYNIREKALMSSSIWAKWLSYLYKEKENAKRIAEAKQKVMKRISQKSASGVSDSILRMKSEEKLAEKDETLQRLNVLSKNTADNIDYIERALNILSNFGYQLRNVTEIIKLNITK